MSFVYIQRGQANCFEALLGTFGCSLLVIRPGWDGSIIGKFDYLIWKMYTHSVGPLVHLLEPYWIYNWLWIPARKWLEDLKRLRKITWWYVFFPPCYTDDRLPQVSAFTAWTRAMELLQMLRNGLQVWKWGMPGYTKWHVILGEVWENDE